MIYQRHGNEYFTTKRHEDEFKSSYEKITLNTSYIEKIVNRISFYGF